MIRPVRIEDGAAICGIYNHYIEHTVITFEEEPLSPEIMENRIRDISAHYPWLVWEEEGQILGYAYAHKWHERAAYRYTAEDSIYIKEGCQGRGIGGKLLARLLGEEKESGVRAIMAVITLPNERSTALHEKFGFTKVGHFKKVGCKFDAWLDVGYWELIL
jgi:phosphinothricin acetyltransferase